MTIEEDNIREQTIKKHINELHEAATRLKMILAEGNVDGKSLAPVDVFAYVNSAIESSGRLIEAQQRAGEDIDSTSPFEWQRSAYSLGIRALLKISKIDPITRQELLRGFMIGYTSASLRIAEIYRSEIVETK